MAPEQLFEKISNFENMNVLYIILKHVLWRFRIYNYFREIFRFRDFMNTLRNFAKSEISSTLSKVIGDWGGGALCLRLLFCKIVCHD